MALSWLGRAGSLLTRTGWFFAGSLLFLAAPATCPFALGAARDRTRTVLSQAFAQFRKYGFAVFRKLAQAFAIHDFASFRNVSQLGKDSQIDHRKSWPDFRKDSQWALC